ncbi:MAG: fatty acid desaturase family protein [Deltaproteobacteria bacterium]|nr:fatty acid desaturase family protein [Deltaproteobacteria bacterium]
MKVTEILSNEEIKLLKSPSDARGWLAVATTWALIAAMFALVAWRPSTWTALVALVVLGGRHLALAILMHDCAHYSLFRTRALNDVVGRWLCAYPTWQDLPRYREHHLRHHKFAGSKDDPDLDLVAPFPVSRASLARKLARDASGVSGLKRVYGLLLMDLGFVKYTVSNVITKLPQGGRTKLDVLKTGARNLHGVALTNAALFGALWLGGHPALYLLWLGSYLTTFSVFVRVRSIAEHACTEQDLDPFKNTRSTEANWVARLTVAPIRVNYHLEHHLLMTVPYFNLPRLHRMLAERGALKNAYNAGGYAEVLLTASGG